MNAMRDLDKALHPNQVKLIDYGWCPAIQADQLKVGQTLRYNYGYTAVVVKIEHASPQFLAITTDNGTGRVYTRRYKRTKLVPVTA